MESSFVGGMNLEQRLDIARDFDFNLGLQEGWPTFEYRFMLNNWNNLGERYTPQSAHVVIMEFRKFMALNASETLTLTSNQLRYRTFEWINNVWHYESALHPYPEVGKFHNPLSIHLNQKNYLKLIFIDRVWKYLIQDTETYAKFWIKLCGGILDRRDPIENPIITYSQQGTFTSVYNRHKMMMNQYLPLYLGMNLRQDFVSFSLINLTFLGLVQLNDIWQHRSKYRRVYSRYGG